MNKARGGGERDVNSLLRRMAYEKKREVTMKELLESA